MWNLRFKSCVCREAETLPLGHLRKPCSTLSIISQAVPLTTSAHCLLAGCNKVLEKAQISPKINGIHFATWKIAGVMSPWAVGWRLGLMEVTEGLGTLCPDTKGGILVGVCPCLIPDGGTEGTSGEEPL